MQYPYSKIEGGIILSILLILWGIGAAFKGFSMASDALLAVGGIGLVILYYLRFIKK